ncbi:hypothetical protein TrST_g13885 [Triparma strigata]|uniref:FAD-binding PCMH-type domain-containing protein n=1 Tax=Triparma strigata TaxID=1606541 RepID=A0A9W7BVL5_9STRA|nr:hypothetical protein TrST_g13885 [Triparma strigata]
MDQAESHEDRKQRIKRDRNAKRAEKEARKRAKKARADARRGIDRSVKPPSRPLSSLSLSPPPPPPLPTPSTAAAPNPSSVPSVALFGCGSWFSLKHHQPYLAKLHTKLPNPSIKIKSIFSRSAASVSKSSKVLAHNNVSTDHLQVFSGSDFPPASFFDNVDIVIVTLPFTGNHTENCLKRIMNQYPNMKLIVEKPAPPLPLPLSTNIAVLENWIAKPSFAKFKKMLSLHIMDHGRPTSYKFTLTQSAPENDDDCWRELKYCVHDVGVHAVRIIRDLFGEVAEVTNDSTFLCDEANRTVKAEGSLLHESELTGQTNFQFRPGLSRSENEAKLRVLFANERELEYDVTNAEGDSWIGGGVSAALSAAITFVTNSNSTKNSSMGRRLCYEEGRRDVMVVDKLVSGGGTVDAVNVVQKLANKQTSSYSNTTSTNTKEYDFVIRCGGINDVKRAVTKANRFARGPSTHIEIVGGENMMKEGEGGGRIRLEIPTLTRFIHFNSESLTVTVQSGMTLRTLTSLLAERGYGLPSLPILLDQTVGGCIATGSHGSGLGLGTISDQVVAVQIVLFETGECVRLTEDNKSAPQPEDDRLKCARCSLGRLGVVVEVTLQATKLKKFARTEVIVSTAAEIDAVSRAHEHCWIHWVGNRGFAICLDEAQEAEGGVSVYNGRNWYPFSAELEKEMDGRNVVRKIPGGRNWTMQFSVDLSLLGELLQVMKRVETTFLNKFGSSPPFELKFLRRSSRTIHAPNSCQIDDAAGGWVALNVWWECAEEDLFELKREMEGLSGWRVHYGKYHGRVEAIRPSFTLTNSTKPPTISVVLPVYNALPYLAPAVRDVLKQEVGGGLELVLSDDGSKDGSFEWILELCEEMKKAGRDVEVIEVDDRDGYGENPARNPSKLLKTREGADIKEDAATTVPCVEKELLDHPVTVKGVVNSVALNAKLILVRQKVRANRGQGKTQTRCLKACRGKYIGFMEADDERDEGNYAELVELLELKEGDIDAACCRARCIGWDREGMERYTAWQNGLLSNSDMRAARFLEIPSLMQAMVLRREALLPCLVEGGKFMDSEMWSIDYHFWLQFFKKGFRVEKLEEGGKFSWRQHPGQQTRNHGRLSIENMRKCKCQVLAEMARDGADVLGEGAKRRIVTVYSVGATLKGWVADLQAEGLEVEGREWRGGRGEEEGGKAEENDRTMRLFAFGMEKMRNKILKEIGTGWREEMDFFVS